MYKNLNKDLKQSSAPEGVDSNGLNMLLGVVSSRLGCTPQQLRAQLESGELEKQIKSSDNPQLDGIKQILNDPEAAQKIINDPKAKQAFKRLRK